MSEFIWNGVGLTTPGDWEPSALERDGLLLESHGLPRCEIKWRTIQGTFSFAKHLKRLVKGHKGVDMHAVALEETPPGWQEAAANLSRSGFGLHSFIWQTPVHKGIGAALHNPATGLAALIQFFIADDSDEDVAAKTLATFRDYTGGKTIPWAMFGLSARVPASFRLDTFSFKPGHYQVKYWLPKSAKQGEKLPAGKGPGTRLTFERFAPASVLLKGTDLQTWITDNLTDAPLENIDLASEADRIAWAGIAKTSMLRKILGKQVHAMGRGWTTDAANAILAVHAAGTIPLADDIFNAIIESYELV